MKKLAFLLIPVLFWACADKNTSTLNGYWEIKSVTMPEGKNKDYPASPTVDYFELKGNKGFRKKVMPLIDGTYRASDSSEEVALVEKDGKTWVTYTTPFATWQEELISVSKNELVLKNTYGMEYHYVRPENFTLNEDGKKAE